MTDDDKPDDLPPDQPDDGSANEPLVLDARAARVYESKKRRVERERKEGEEFWRKALNTFVGRREIWRLLTDARTFEERFASGPNGFPNSQATDYYRGERDFGLRLYQKLLVIDLEHVSQMHIENDTRFVRPPGQS